jgi:hypothetical protein
VLADLGPRRNARGMRRPVAGHRCFSVQPLQDVICGDLNALATGLLGCLDGGGDTSIC